MKKLVVSALLFLSFFAICLLPVYANGFSQSISGPGTCYPQRQAAFQCTITVDGNDLLIGTDLYLRPYEGYGYQTDVRYYRNSPGAALNSFTVYMNTFGYVDSLSGLTQMSYNAGLNRTTYTVFFYVTFDLAFTDSASQDVKMVTWENSSGTAYGQQHNTLFTGIYSVSQSTSPNNNFVPFTVVIIVVAVVVVGCLVFAIYRRKHH